LIFVLRTVFTQVLHPVALVVVILIQTTACCLFLISFYTTRWFSFILFLIFLGGVIVLFIYIASLASNEKFIAEYKNWIALFIATSLFIVLFVFTQNNQTTTSHFYHESEGLINIYIKSTSAITRITILYLLLILVVVVKITSKFEGPLRNIVYQN